MSEEVTIEIRKMEPFKSSTGIGYYLCARSNKFGSILSPQAWVRKSTAEKWAKKMKETNERHGILTKIVDTTENEIRKCALCEKSGKGKRLLAPTCMPLWVCTDCIERYSEEECLIMLEHI